MQKGTPHNANWDVAFCKKATSQIIQIISPERMA